MRACVRFKRHWAQTLVVTGLPAPTMDQCACIHTVTCYAKNAPSFHTKPSLDDSDQATHLDIVLEQGDEELVVVPHHICSRCVRASQEKEGGS
jgi:hypothetical protein